MRRDAVVIGGGFYGCCIAAHLARAGRRVVLVERAPELMTRASYVNQARLHGGYHYLRSFRTAARSRQNLDQFRTTFADGVAQDYTQVYAIARHDSKVSARHFVRFCGTVGLPFKPAPKAITRLFSPRLIDRAFVVDEPAFDATALRRALERQMAPLEIEIRLSTSALKVAPAGRGDVTVELDDGTTVTAPWAFNCTYAALNRLAGLDPADPARLKHQITEIALIEPPPALARLGITVMDGPFFSTMPFPARGLHSLSHVRYTPHVTWAEAEAPELDPLAAMAAYNRQSRYEWMLHDAARFVPALAEARHVDSLFDIKTLLMQTEIDDARPILFHPDKSLPHLVSILGGKIDNIYDVIRFLGSELELT